MSGATGNKKFLIPGVLGAVIIVALIAVYTASASAQNATNLAGENSTEKTAPPTKSSNSMQQTAPSGKIVGSIDVKQQARNFLSEKITVTLAEASSKAESQVNGKAISTNLSVVEGYLVYTIKVANLSDGSVQKVIVDAGNGNVLYISPAKQSGHTGLGILDGAFGQEGYKHHHRHHHDY